MVLARLTASLVELQPNEETSNELGRALAFWYPASGRAGGRAYKKSLKLP